MGASTLPPNAVAPPVVPPPARQAQSTRKTPVQAPAAASAQDAGATLGGADAHRMGLIQLPKDKRYSLAVIQGAATGRSSRSQDAHDRGTLRLRHQPRRPGGLAPARGARDRGRRRDPRDLGSTNGTLIELDRVEQHELSNQQEFRIGSHVLMFIVTDVDERPRRLGGRCAPRWLSPESPLAVVLSAVRCAFRFTPAPQCLGVMSPWKRAPPESSPSHSPASRHEAVVRSAQQADVVGR